MKIIIDIPEEQRYEWVKRCNHHYQLSENDVMSLLNGVKNGTPISAEGEYIKKSDVLEELEESGTFYRKRADEYKDTDVERASVAKAVANVYKYLTLFVSGLPAISIHNKAESEDI